MPDTFPDGMTVLTRKAFESASARNLSAGKAAKALAAVPVRSFAEILSQFAPEEAGQEELVRGLCENNPRRNRASMEKKVRDWLHGKYRPTKREDLLELCFLLKLPAEEADAFLAAASDTGLHWRDPRELTYAFALRKGMTYAEAAALLQRVLPEKSAEMSETGNSFTPAIQGEAARLETEDELKRYLRDAWNRLGENHNMAYMQLMDYLSLLEKPQALRADEEESYTVRRIVETYLDSRFPPECNRKKLDRKRKEILAGWPDEVTLSRMKTRKTDVTRKTLMLLFLATDGGEEEADGWREEAGREEEKDAADAEFRSSYMRMNQMLSACGYRMLDPRSPFDWVVIYCLRAGADPEAMEGLSEKLAEMLGVLFTAVPQ